MKAELTIPPELAAQIAAEVIAAIKPILAAKAPEADDRLMDVPALARYLGVTTQRVYDAVALAEIPSLKVGRYVRFKRSVVDKWVESQMIPATSPSRLKLVKPGGRT